MDKVPYILHHNFMNNKFSHVFSSLYRGKSIDVWYIQDPDTENVLLGISLAQGKFVFYYNPASLGIVNLVGDYTLTDELKTLCMDLILMFGRSSNRLKEVE